MNRHNLNLSPEYPAPRRAHPSAPCLAAFLGLVGLVWLGSAGPARAESVGAYDMGSNCVTSDDCSSAHEGRRCLAERGYCGCDTNDDCDPVGQICSQSQKRCVAAECRTDKECATSPNGRVCDLDTGRCGCSSHAECGAGQACRAGSCQAAQCQTDKDCAGNPGGPHCDVATLYCSCSADSECADSTRGVACLYGSCGCAADSHCGAGTFCAGDGVCFAECRSDADCGPGGSCDDSGRCLYPEPLPEPEPKPEPEPTPSDVDGPADRADASTTGSNDNDPTLVAPRSAGCTVGAPAAASAAGDGAPTYGLVALALLGLGLIARPRRRR